MKWYKRGFEEGNKAMDAEKKRAESRSSGFASIRFWMPKDSDKTLVFLTDEPFIYLEHNYKDGGHWRNWVSCLKPMGVGCGYCELDMNLYQAAAFTVVDCTPWVDKEGVEHKYSKRLYVAKFGVWEKLERERQLLAEDGLPMRGAIYRVFRGQDKKAPAVGDDFKYKRHVPLEQWDGVDTEEFDYATLLMPDESKMLTIIEGLAGGTSMAPADTVEEVGGADTDKIPF